MWFRRLRRPQLAAPLLLYSRPECGLCAAAAAAVRAELGARSLRVVNIVGNRELEDAYVLRIPVLTYRGQVLAEGIIGATDARRAGRRAAALDRAVAEQP